jgi:hypothetical protein
MNQVLFKNVMFRPAKKFPASCERHDDPAPNSLPTVPALRQTNAVNITAPDFFYINLNVILLSILSTPLRWSHPFQTFK